MALDIQKPVMLIVGDDEKYVCMHTSLYLNQHLLQSLTKATSRQTLAHIHSQDRVLKIIIGADKDFKEEKKFELMLVDCAEFLKRRVVH